MWQKIKDAQFEEKKDIRKLNVDFTASEEKDGIFFLKKGLIQNWMGELYVIGKSPPSKTYNFEGKYLKKFWFPKCSNKPYATVNIGRAKVLSYAGWNT